MKFEKEELEGLLQMLNNVTVRGDAVEGFLKLKTKVQWYLREFVAESQDHQSVVPDVVLAEKFLAQKTSGRVKPSQKQSAAHTNS